MLVCRDLFSALICSRLAALGVVSLPAVLPIVADLLRVGVPLSFAVQNRVCFVTNSFVGTRALIDRVVDSGDAFFVGHFIIQGCLVITFDRTRLA